MEVVFYHRYTNSKEAFSVLLTSPSLMLATDLLRMVSKQSAF